jgi:hypothetical protein
MALLGGEEDELGFLDGGATAVTVGAGPVSGQMGVAAASGRAAAPTMTSERAAAASGRVADVSGPALAAQTGVADMFRQSSHPVAAVFHVAFKALALFFYLFGTWFSSSFVLLFVLCIVSLAFDFWTVKNVTGRLMVGLRWWNDIADDGSNVWRFESIENLDGVSGADYSIFWYAQYLNVALWTLFGFLDLLKLQFDWLVLVVVAVSLGASNVYGYWQCSKDARARLEGAVRGAVQQQAMNAFASSIGSSIGSSFGKAFGTAGSGTGAGAAHSTQATI